MGVLIFLAGCEKEEAFQDSHDGYIFKRGERASRILEIPTKEDYLSTMADLEASADDFEPAEDEQCYLRPDLDNYENQQSNFRSLRKKYEDLNCDLFNQNEGFPDGVALHACPIIDPELATLFNDDGLLIIEDELYAIYNPAVSIITNPNNLAAVELVRNQIDLPPSARTYPKEIVEDLEFHSRTSVCEPEFTVQVNNSTGNVHLTIVEDAIPLGEGQAGDFYWDLPNSSSNFHNQPTVQFSSTPNVANYDVCLTYEVTETIEIEQDQTTEQVRVCIGTICQSIQVGDCVPDFNYTIGQNGVVSFVNVSSVAFGEITGVEWIFGDGETSTEVLPTHAYPCNSNYDVTLVIYSEDCPNGSASITRTVDLNSLTCCDRNPDLGGLFNYYGQPYADGKRMLYRYNMNAVIPWDQRFKAVIWNQEQGLFGLWFGKQADLFIDFEGNLYDSDENDCQCALPFPINETPSTPVHRKKQTFKDPLDSFTGLANFARMKLGDSPILHFQIDGANILDYTCTDAPGFQCEN